MDKANPYEPASGLQTMAGTPELGLKRRLDDVADGSGIPDAPNFSRKEQRALRASKAKRKGVKEADPSDSEEKEEEEEDKQGMKKAMKRPAAAAMKRPSAAVKSGGRGRGGEKIACGRGGRGRAAKVKATPKKGAADSAAGEHSLKGKAKAKAEFQRMMAIAKVDMRSLKQTARNHVASLPSFHVGMAVPIPKGKRQPIRAQLCFSGIALM